jgi:hypothetical protein
MRRLKGLLVESPATVNLEGDGFFHVLLDGFQLEMFLVLLELGNFAGFLGVMRVAHLAVLLHDVLALLRAPDFVVKFFLLNGLLL